MQVKKIIALIICIIIVAIIGVAIWYMSKQRETKNNYNESNLFSNNKEQKEMEITETDDGLIFINGGTFEMGSPENELQRNEDEKQHVVTISDFYIGKYEVTQKEYQEIMGENSSNFKGEDLPVENITWYDAIN